MLWGHNQEMTLIVVSMEQSYFAAVITGNSCIYEFEVGVPKLLNKMQDTQLNFISDIMNISSIFAKYYPYIHTISPFEIIIYKLIELD